jgi:predicted AAA+ superfamily ATPase
MVNRGAIVEAFVGQELLCYSTPYTKTALYYWKRADKQTKAEVDYVYEYKRQVVPLEAKSGDGRSLKSMHLFLQMHGTSSYGMRFSAQNYSNFDHIISKPLYDVVSLAHEDQKEALQFLLSQ